MKADERKYSDENFCSLLSSIKQQTAAPDTEFLNKLRDRSAGEFEAAASDGSESTQKSVHSISVWRKIMKSNIVKLAAAAVIVIAVAVGLSGILSSSDGPTVQMPGTSSVSGPMTIKLPDGSSIALAKNARLKLYDNKAKRGFEHIAGQVDVTVAKAEKEFVVATPYGTVKALGTKFTMDLVDGIAANTGEKVQLLAVQVAEGSVQVSNAKGSKVLRASGGLTVQKDKMPYDFNQDQNLPARLRQRMQAMLDALEAGDAAAWLSNYNIDYMYKLIKGQVEYDPKLFGGSKEDAERLQKTHGNIGSPAELVERFLASGEIKASGKLYVRSVELSEDGNHAIAVCVASRNNGGITATRPQWHYFDSDWWQIDD